MAPEVSDRLADALERVADKLDSLLGVMNPTFAAEVAKHIDEQRAFVADWRVAGAKAGKSAWTPKAAGAFIVAIVTALSGAIVTIIKVAQ